MNESMYYRLPEFRVIFDKAVHECLDMMYRMSQPATTLEAAMQEAKRDKETDPDGRDLVQDRHYLPRDVQQEITEHYLEVYGLNDHWDDHADIMKSFLDGEPYIRIPKSDDENVTIEEQLGMKKLDNIRKDIGDENTDKVLERMNQCKKAYSRNYKKESFSWNMFDFAPSSNKELVETYWNEHGKDLTIDDSVYSEDYEGDYWDVLFDDNNE